MIELTANAIRNDKPSGYTRDQLIARLSVCDSIGSDCAAMLEEKHGIDFITDLRDILACASSESGRNRIIPYLLDGLASGAIGCAKHSDEALADAAGALLVYCINDDDSSLENKLSLSADLARRAGHQRSVEFAQCQRDGLCGYAAMLITDHLSKMRILPAAIVDQEAQLALKSAQSFCHAICALILAEPPESATAHLQAELAGLDFTIENIHDRFSIAAALRQSVEARLLDAESQRCANSAAQPRL